MTTLLLFALALLLAVLLSDLAYRSILSTAVLFLVVGFACGSGGLGIISLDSDTPAVRILADLALFSILFTDGMRVDLGELRASWRPPGRALLFGLPLTLLGTALAGHFIAGPVD